MGKRGVGVFVGVLLAAAGFAAGWLSRTPTASSNEPAPAPPVTPPPRDAPPAYTPTPKDTIAFWSYKLHEGYGPPDSSSIGSLMICRSTSSDDIVTVADWYGKKFERPIPIGQKTGRGLDMFGNSVATADDSLRTGLSEPRPVKVGLGVWYSKATVVNVTLTQAEGEKETHILISHLKLQ